jgi:Tfp pilus assembly protein PilF
MEWLAAHAQSPDARALVALYYGMRGDFAAARVQVQRALEIDPTNSLGYLVLAMLAEQGGDVDGAIAAAERSLRLTAEGASNAPARQLLARLRARSNWPLRLKPPSLRR